MPNITFGAYHGLEDRQTSFVGKDLGYKYPYGLDLRPYSKLHNRIVERVLRMAQDSYDVISRKHAVWNSLDETMTAFIELSAYEKELKKMDKNRPVSIVVPYSYAAVETILAYNTKAFLADEVFQYEGQAPEDVIGAAMLQLVVNQQVHRFKTALDIHTGFRDGLVYGFHASNVYWDRVYGRKPVVEEIPQYSPVGTVLGVKKNVYSEPTLLFEGNRLRCIDPYRCLPDPNVSIHRVNDGEFFGWSEDVTLSSLLLSEVEEQGDMFNVRYLKDFGSGIPTSKFAGDKSKREKDAKLKGVTQTTNYKTLVNMYVNLVPSEWGLPGDPDYNPDGDLPEKWTFTVAEDTVLIRCSRLGLNHNRFPIAVNSPDYDGYSISPISRLEMNSGLQEVLNWVFNSHIANVRKALNDMFVVDPSLISLKDLENPEPGKLLRLRRNAWGRGVEGAIKQLQVNDVTRNNIVDAGFVIDIMQKVSATSDAAMGFFRGGVDRRTATEFSGTFGSVISRLEHLARITSLMYMQDLGYLHASHTQQLMSKEVFVKASGEWPRALLNTFGNTPYLKVSPTDLIVDFDVVVKDGSSRTIGSDQLAFWSNILPVLLGNPVLFKIFDITRIFKRIAMLSGEKNVEDFIAEGGNIEAKVVADEHLAREREKGNVVKAEELLDEDIAQRLEAI